VLALGAGFHPYLTGRENIYVNGAILGMSRSEIEAKIESIIKFAGIGDFIDAPLSTYSSGMRVRLGFSIAIATKPDLLLLDEVIAVGDRAFKARCYNELDKMAGNTAIIYVSHHMPKVERVCSDIMVLDHGKIRFQSGEVSKGIEYYLSQFAPDQVSISGSGEARVDNFRLSSGEGLVSDEGPFEMNYLDDLLMEFALSLDSRVQNALVKVSFYDKEFNVISTSFSNLCDFEIKNSSSQIELFTRFPKLQLSPGAYCVFLAIRDQDSGKVLVKYHNIAELRIVGNFNAYAPFHLRSEWGLRKPNETEV
jgi:lipopolysaccharide transport system ATP-binding protein